LLEEWDNVEITCWKSGTMLRLNWLELKCVVHRIESKPTETCYNYFGLLY